MTAPLSGIIQKREGTVGETVEAGRALFSIVNLSVVWAQLSVAPKDLGHVREGQTVELKADSVPGRTFRATVSAIGSGTDELRTVRVRAALDNSQGLLKPGMFVTGDIITDVRMRQVVAPDSALQDHQGKPTVYVTPDGKPTHFEVRHVTLGESASGVHEITGGLKPGERIAVNGTFYLKSEALKSQLSDGCCAVPGL